MNNTISFKITNDNINILVNKYEEYKVFNSSQYIDYTLKTPYFTIIIYKSNKCVIQGDFDPNDFVQYGYIKEDYGWDLNYTHIGSDEVGTGDYFGPIIVASCYVKESQLKELKKIGVNDSKKLTDKFILETVPSLLKKYPHKIKMISNEEYNQIHDEYNLNKMKALLHNDCLSELSKETKCKSFVIDQFCSKEKYNEYTKNCNNQLDNIVFITKGESHSASVALASMFARFTFLYKIQELEEKYMLEIPLGSNKKAQEYASNLLIKNGLEFLKKVCKTDFKNIVK